MVTAINNSVLAAMFGQSAGLSTPLAGAAASPKKVAPTAPWQGGTIAADPSAAVKAALQGRKFIDEGAAKLDVNGASADYRKLFALYQGLSTLLGLAERIGQKGVSAMDKSQIQRAFARGMAEVGGYVSAASFEKLRLTQGEALDRAKAATTIPRNKTEYVTPAIFSGTSTDAVPAFQGAVQFNIKIKRAGTDHNVAIDLSGMGGQVRSMANVVNYINDQLAAAGVDSRLATQRIPGKPKTIESGGKTITVGQGPDQWALRVKVSTGETVGFDAPASAGAVYLAQSAGDPDPDGKPTTSDGVVRQQFLKFQTDTATVPSPLQAEGEANWVEGRAFARTLGPEVKTVRASRVGPDGSVYMLADVSSKIAGQAIKGEQDVALLKYDAAGQLVFSRTLGAADTATGLGLAVSADGKVAISGAVTGELAGAKDGPMNSGETGSFAANSDSFVTLFDADGQELWTQRRGARQGDEAANVAFGADGTVYVQGRSQSLMPGAAAGPGGWDNYIQAFKTDAAGKVSSAFTHVYGSAAADRPAGMVLDGSSLVTAAVENGRAVLRRFDVSGATPVLTATRDLGDLQGGEISGLALDGGDVVVVGSTRNAALSAGAVTRAHAGGSDAFAARLSSSLSPAGTDRLAYYGGAGDDRATALAVDAGKVWIAGAAGTDIPNHTSAVGKKDAFLTQLDLGTGAVAWSRRFTGKDGFAAPTSIAVDPAGASVLDRLGLPKGTLDMTDSQRITAQTAIRAGDSFTVRSGTGRWTTVSIDEAETLDTLAQKIRRATGFQAKVTVSSSGGVRSLSITPVSTRSVIEFSSGKTDKDALELLGIPEGVVRATRSDDGKTVSADGKPMFYGLGLDTGLNLDNATEISHALADVAKAQGVVRQIYRDLVQAASPRNPLATAQLTGGPAPAYLTNQIANYQAALARLGGG